MKNYDWNDHSLNRLPMLNAPEHIWADIAEELPVKKRFGYSGTWFDLAAAASLFLLIALGVPSLVNEPETESKTPNWASYSSQLDRLYAQSNPKAVLSADEALAIANLEDKISRVDQMIPDQAEMNQEKLWRYRSALMRQLISVQTQPISNELAL